MFATKNDLPQQIEVRPDTHVFLPTTVCEFSSTRKLSIKVIDLIDPFAAHIRALDKLVGEHTISVYKHIPLPGERHPLIHLHDLEPALFKSPGQLRDPVGRLLRPHQARYLSRRRHGPQEYAARLEKEDRAVLRGARRQIFNYSPKGFAYWPKDSVSGDEAWRLVSSTEYTVDKSEGSFIWNIGFQEAPRLRIRAEFNPDMFSEKEAESFVESVFGAVEFLSDTGNWERGVGELRAALSEKRETSVLAT